MKEKFEQFTASLVLLLVMFVPIGMLLSFKTIEKRIDGYVSHLESQHEYKESFNTIKNFLESCVEAKEYLPSKNAGNSEIMFMAVPATSTTISLTNNLDGERYNKTFRVACTEVNLN